MISKEQNLDPQHPIHHVRVHLSHAIEFQELPPIDLRMECHLLSRSQVCSHGSISTGRVEKAVAIRARKDATFFLQSAGIFLRSTSQSASLEYVMSMGSSETGSTGVAPVCWSIAEHWQIVKQLASTNRRALPLLCKAKLDCSMTTYHIIISVVFCYHYAKPCLFHHRRNSFLPEHPTSKHKSAGSFHLAQVCVTCISI